MSCTPTLIWNNVKKISGMRAWKECMNSLPPPPPPQLRRVVQGWWGFWQNGGGGGGEYVSPPPPPIQWGFQCGQRFKQNRGKCVPPPPPPIQWSFQGWWGFKQNRGKYVCPLNSVNVCAPPPIKKINRSHTPMVLTVPLHYFPRQQWWSCWYGECTCCSAGCTPS